MKAFFVFSGQGAQTVGMGRDLFESSAAARKVFEEADEVLGYKLSDIIFNGPIEKLTESIYCQDAIYTTSCAAYAAFTEKFGKITPVACAGLSLGEYGALHCADLIQAAAQRGEPKKVHCDRVILECVDFVCKQINKE